MYKLYAHRGNTGSIIPEENQTDNSIENISVSITRPYITGFELDFRLTKDGILVATHDKSIHNISEKREKRNINDMTLKELQAQKMHDVFYYYKNLKIRSRFLADSKRIIDVIESKLDSKAMIQTADDTLNYIANTNPKKEVLLELKEKSMQGAYAMIDLINKFKSRLELSAHGFNIQHMRAVKGLTGVKTGILVNTFLPLRLTKANINDLEFDFISSVWVYIKIHQLYNIAKNEKSINFWTIDSPNHYLNILDIINKFERKHGSLEDFGTTVGIITNIPDVLHEYDITCKVKK